jgi:DNA topoisomerase III
MVQNGEIKVLNVAEKPSVARALAQVFRNCHGTGGPGVAAVRDRGSQRDVHELFTHENVHFPNVYTQGDGRTVHGPCTCCCCCC